MIVLKQTGNSSLLLKAPVPSELLAIDPLPPDIDPPCTFPAI